MALSARLASQADIPQVMEIYAHARRFMAANGNPNQWGTAYPQAELVQDDLEKEQLYVCLDHEEVVGVFCYFQGIDEDYLNICGGKWINDMPYGVIHRLAVKAHSHGIAAFCFRFAFDQCGNLRIDTHRDNIPMQRALSKSGFQYCGVIRSRYGGERLAYQKTGV